MTLGMLFTHVSKQCNLIVDKQWCCCVWLER